MYSQHDKYPQMQSKLQEGLQLLSAASNEDADKLGLALIKLHGALEDFVRMEVGRKAPLLRSEVEDARKTTWRDLIAYSKQYLGFTESDARIISDANMQRQEVAHGGNYGKSRAELVRYAEFVQRRCNPGESLRDLTYRKPAAPPPVTYQTPSFPRQQTASAPTSGSRPIPAQPTYSPHDRKPWYRSTLFLFLMFFLLPPLWAVLIITDRKHGCLARLLAYLVLFIVFFTGAIFIQNSGNISDTLQELVIPYISTRTAHAMDPPASNESPSTVTDETSLQPVSASGETCTIVWVKHGADDLAGKNRSMVWEEIVQAQVHGSGLSPREFYNLVIKHNPDLVTDGYEFKKGKTYFLPECQ
jgi:hypothetical protein